MAEAKLPKIDRVNNIRSMTRGRAGASRFIHFYSIGGAIQSYQMTNTIINSNR
jgi:hypothetical protein